MLKAIFSTHTQIQSIVKTLKNLNGFSGNFVAQRTSSNFGKDPPDFSDHDANSKSQSLDLPPKKASKRKTKESSSIRVEDIGKKILSHDLVFPPSVYDKRVLKIDQYGLPLLTPKDCSRRLEFATKTLAQIEKNKDILPSLVFSDEGNFRIFRRPSSYKGRRNESKNLPVIVWCGMTSRDIVGPYFFNSYVTENTYLRMIKSYFVPKLQELGYPIERTWFQQDGAPPHRSKKVLKYLKQRFGHRLISYGTTQYWPSKSQDLTPLDYFLWDHLKEKINVAYRPTTADDMKECISLELDNIDPDLLEIVIFDFRNRLQSCIHARGDRFESRKNYT